MKDRRRQAQIVLTLAVTGFWFHAFPAHAESETHGSFSSEQKISGEVVAMWCYLREGPYGKGKINSDKIKNCIRLGSPIAIRTGKTLYIVDTQDAGIKNALSRRSGYPITVYGTPYTQAGRAFIKITSPDKVLSPR